MPILQADRKRLLKQIDMAEQYQKIRHNGSCSDNADCISHCKHLVFLIQNMLNIIHSLDEIGQKTEKITDKDIQHETKFDFENASEHIVEWSRHNLRAARQDAEKKLIISQMGDDEAFPTFDWAQKIFPQEYREAQSVYFGKVACQY